MSIKYSIISIFTKVIKLLKIEIEKLTSNFSLPFSLYALVFYRESNSEKLVHLLNTVYFIICMKFVFCEALEEFFYAFYLISFFIQFLFLKNMTKILNGALKICQQI